MLTAGYIKRGKRLVYDIRGEDTQRTDKKILSYLKSAGTEDLVICI
jgi:hypothetical protein